MAWLGSPSSIPDSLDNICGNVVFRLRIGSLWFHSRRVEMTPPSTLKQCSKSWRQRRFRISEIRSRLQKILYFDACSDQWIFCTRRRRFVYRVYKKINRTLNLNFEIVLYSDALIVLVSSSTAEKSQFENYVSKSLWCKFVIWRAGMLKCNSCCWNAFNFEDKLSPNSSKLSSLSR